MAVRLLFLFFVVVIVAFGYISVLNGQHIQFYYSTTRNVDIAVSELALLSFAIGAAMVILGTLVKDVTQASANWKERREKQRREAAKARVNKAAGLLSRGILEEASREVSKSLSVSPDDRDALDLLANIEICRGNSIEAIKALSRLKQLDPENLSAYLRLAGVYRDTNDLESALSVLKTIEDFEGENPRAWEQIRDIHILRGEMVPAYAMQKKLIKQKGKSATAEDIALFAGLRYEKAIRRMADGKADDAERRLRDLIQEQPRFSAAHIALAEQMRGRGNIEEATTTLLRGYRATRNAVFLIKLEDLGVETERPHAMIAVYTELLHEFPADIDVNMFLGKLFLRLEMNDEAVEQFLKAEALDPERESLHILLAEALRRRGRYESACQHYQAAFGYRRRYLIPFRCTGCGTATIKWTARCSSCGIWNGYEIERGRREFAVAASVR